MAASSREADRAPRSGERGGRDGAAVGGSSERWGKTVVVENRPGADGIVGITAFLAGSPDDHVLLFAPTGTFTAHPFLHENLSYNPDQLVPIARVTN
jgi:tripartite-type tricarboxylate transporter receptor subunit TctC